jgi:hypothetical protein
VWHFEGRTHPRRRVRMEALRMTEIVFEIAKEGDGGFTAEAIG